MSESSRQQPDGLTVVPVQDELLVHDALTDEVHLVSREAAASWLTHPLDRRVLLQRSAVVGAVGLGSTVLVPAAAWAASTTYAAFPKLSQSFGAAPAGGPGTLAASGPYALTAVAGMQSGMTVPTASGATLPGTQLSYVGTEGSTARNRYQDKASPSNVYVTPGSSVLININNQSLTYALEVVITIPAGTNPALTLTVNPTGEKAATTFEIADQTGAVRATAAGGPVSYTFSNLAAGDRVYVVVYNNSATSDKFSPFEISGA